MSRVGNPSGVLMIRPTFFSVNSETAADNTFQAEGAEGDGASALAEFDQMVALLRDADVRVEVFEQERADTPDAVFPNNWISTHADGTVVIYPMAVASRRRERRQDIINYVSSAQARLLDLTAEERAGRALEGTGAIVFDHIQHLAFLARSGRADEHLFDELCRDLAYTAVVFDAEDRQGHAIYHTNVMMAVGSHIALVGLSTIANLDQRQRVALALQAVDRPVVELSADQIQAFAGNALEVDTPNGPVLVMSDTGWGSLSKTQQDKIEAALPVITPKLPTIEKSGGSARCMMAGLHGLNPSTRRPWVRGRSRSKQKK